MAAVTETNIQILSRTEVAEVVLDRAKTNDLFRILPFVPIDGHSLVLAAVEAGPSLAAHATVETEGGALQTSMPSFEGREFKLSRFSGVLEVSTITQDKYSSKSDVLQVLLDIKTRAVKDKFCEKLYTGDEVTAGEFDGLKKLATSYGQQFFADGGAGGTVKKGELEKLRALVQVDQPSAEIAFVMNAEAYKHLLAVSYSDVEFVMHAVLGALPAISGVPILIDNFISTTEGVGNNETTIYCLALGRNVGVTGVVPAGGNGQEIRIRGPVTNETQGKMSYHVSWDVGIAVWNKGGMAAMEKVQHANLV